MRLKISAFLGNAYGLGFGRFSFAFQLCNFAFCSFNQPFDISAVRINKEECNTRTEKYQCLVAVNFVRENVVPNDER